MWYPQGDERDIQVEDVLCSYVLLFAVTVAYLQRDDTTCSEVVGIDYDTCLTRQVKYHMPYIALNPVRLYDLCFVQGDRDQARRTQEDMLWTAPIERLHHGFRAEHGCKGVSIRLIHKIGKSLEHL